MYNVWLDTPTANACWIIELRTNRRFIYYLGSKEYKEAKELTVWHGNKSCQLAPTSFLGTFQGVSLIGNQNWFVVLTIIDDVREFAFLAQKAIDHTITKRPHNYKFQMTKQLVDSNILGASYD